MTKKWTVIFFLLIASVACRHDVYTVNLNSGSQNSDCDSVPSFNLQIQPILKTSCAKVGCHDGDNMPIDFSFYENIKPILNDSEMYYYVIKDRKMPEDTPLNAADYQLMKCWLLNGAPDN